MRDFRLKASRSLPPASRPPPGAETSLELNFDDIHYFMTAADRQGKTWDDVPADIKNTFDRAGHPRGREAQVPRRRRRTVRVGGRLSQPA